MPDKMQFRIFCLPVVDLRLETHDYDSLLFSIPMHETEERDRLMLSRILLSNKLHNQYVYNLYSSK